MKLSILIPSNRPDGLNHLIESLKKHSVTDDVELVVLVDGELEYVEFHHNMTVIHYPPKQPLSIAHLLHKCYELSVGDWIMFGNDDIICNTPEWDKMLFKAIEQFGEDGIALFWPDDNMFGSKLSCFPIVSRKLLNLVSFFPQPYQRYKIDDTIHDIIPNSRRFYLSNIQFKHENDQGHVGFELGDGRIYPVAQEAAESDNRQWDLELPNRNRMKRIIRNELGIDTPKILIAIITQEMARRADFYDAIDALTAPPDCELIKIKVHAQSPARGRNMAIEQALANDCSHVLFLDDDVYPQPDAIIRLLSHKKDIVTGLYLSRSFPHRPYIFGAAEEDGSCRWKAINPGDTGLTEIVAAGLGICLISIEVFLKLEKPWIRLGELASDDWCDDIGFFNRCRKAEFKLYCDLDCVAGHAANVIVMPEYTKGQWFTTYLTPSTEGRPAFPQPTSVEAAKVKEETDDFQRQ